MSDPEEPGASAHEKDGRSWRIGGQQDVQWIQAGITRDVRITGAIPPTFDAYASIALCEGAFVDRTPTNPDAAVLMFYARTPVHSRGGWGIWRPGQATSSLTRRRACSSTQGGAT